MTTVWTRKSLDAPVYATERRSIFPEFAIDRAHSEWERYAYVMTPVEWRNGRGYKREDYFAPLGPDAPNGNKMRHLVWLVANHLATARYTGGILSGGSVQAPQLSRSALAGLHFGLPVHLVLGNTKLETARRNENVAMAEAAQATFSFAKISYNPGIQKEIARLHAEGYYKDWYRLPYGITVPDDAPDSVITAYHHLSAWQVQNIPASVSRIIMPMGSANSAVSLLFGLAMWPPEGLNNVTLFGIGPTRLEWMDRRLQAIERHTGIEIRALFRRHYSFHGELAEKHDNALRHDLHRWLLEHHDLHASKYAAYSDRMPYSLDGIDFHSTYEGKILSWLDSDYGRSQFSPWWDGRGNVLFWIVGSDATLAGTLPHIRRHMHQED